MSFVTLRASAVGGRAGGLAWHERGLYRARLVVAGTGGHRRARARARACASAVIVVVAGMLVLALGGCAPSRPLRQGSADTHASRGRRVALSGRPEAPGGATPARDQAILAAWRASVEAFDTAGRTADWQSPALAATRVPPQLAEARQVLYEMFLAGEVAVGTDRIVTERVLSVTGTRSVVKGCVSGGEVDVFASTGRHVPGVGGEPGPVRITSTLVDTPAGWKVAYQTTKEEPCPVG